jgi:hypothetical protein
MSSKKFWGIRIGNRSRALLLQRRFREALRDAQKLRPLGSPSASMSMGKHLIAERLAMGDPSRVSRYCAAAAGVGDRRFHRKRNLFEKMANGTDRPLP